MKLVAEFLQCRWICAYDDTEVNVSDSQSTLHSPMTYLMERSCHIWEQQQLSDGWIHC